MDARIEGRRVVRTVTGMLALIGAGATGVLGIGIFSAVAVAKQAAAQSVGAGNPPGDDAQGSGQRDDDGGNGSAGQGVQPGLGVGPGSGPGSTSSSGS